MDLVVELATYALWGLIGIGSILGILNRWSNAPYHVAWAQITLLALLFVGAAISEPDPTLEPTFMQLYIIGVYFVTLMVGSATGVLWLISNATDSKIQLAVLWLGAAQTGLLFLSEVIIRIGL